jgi:hypothetical protein
MRLAAIAGRDADERMSTRKFLDVRMADGSRHFAEVPWQPPLMLKQRLLDTPGVKLTSYVGSIFETWIVFEYSGQLFSAHNPLNDFWLFVDDPQCPDNVLCEVEDLFRPTRWVKLKTYLSQLNIRSLLRSTKPPPKIQNPCNHE